MRDCRSLRLLTGLLVLSLVCLILTSSPLRAQSGSPSTYVAALFGGQETPPNNSTASGVATLVLSADEKTATIRVSFSGLTTTETAAHIHGPAGAGVSAAPLFSLPLGQITDLVWTFQPTAGLSVQDQVVALKSGRLYVNVHSASIPGGEIRGQFYLSSGQTDIPSPTDPRPNMPSNADAVRFLEQATFGPTQADISHVQQVGLRGYLMEQFVAPVSSYDDVPYVDPSPLYRLKLRFFENAVRNPDQLRQRVAFALNQILVVSTSTSAISDVNKLDAMKSYEKILMRGAFGNYRKMMGDMTLNPAMGAFLNMVNNDKANAKTNSQPNENYARELLQLFSLGVFKLNLDGTLQLDANGQPLPTYSNDEIKAFARALTGWTYAPLPGATMKAHNPQNFAAPMVAYAPNHDTTAKTLLGGAIVPANQTAQADLDAALDNVFNHPNLGPFLCRRLIQHLVTSNPSPAYIARAAKIFNDNGAGVRGDLRAVISTILLDPEANINTYALSGHLRAPVLYLTNVIRALGGTGDLWGVSDRAARMGQDVFNPPTVFSFFQPDFRLIYQTTDGLYTFFGPEAQTLTTNTTLERLNLINTLVYGKISVPTYPVPPSGTTSVTLDWSTLDTLARDTTLLINALDQTLMHGAMPSGMRAAIATAVNALPTNQPHQRAQAAVYLTATAAQYQVQR